MPNPTGTPTVQGLQHVSVPMPPGGQERARRFYGEALGLAEVPPPSDLGHLSLVWFRFGDPEHEIHCFAESGGANTEAQHLCLQVDDIDAFRTRLADHDVLVEETEPIRNRPRFFVHDPFGNRLELTEIRGAYD